MRNSKKNEHILFWSLVLGVFALAILVWLPNLTKNIRELAAEIKFEKNTTVEQLENEWSLAQNQLSNLTENIIQLAEGDSVTDEGLNKLVQGVKTATAQAGDQGGFPEHEVVGTTEYDPAKKLCERDGEYEERASGGYSYGVCIFGDSECEKIAYYKNECAQGQYESAEEGMDLLPDLVVAVKESGYCDTRTTPIVFNDTNEGVYFCLNGMTVRNDGLATAPRAQVLIGSSRYGVPALPPGEEFVFTDAAFYPRSVYASAIVEVDDQGQIEEQSEENNRFEFPN